MAGGQHSDEVLHRIGLLGTEIAWGLTSLKIYQRIRPLSAIQNFRLGRP